MENQRGGTHATCATALMRMCTYVYHLTHECDPTDRTAIQQVIDHVEEEIKKLEALNDEIMETSGPEDERLAAIGDRLDELDPKTFEVCTIQPLTNHLCSTQRCCCYYPQSFQSIS